MNYKFLKIVNSNSIQKNINILYCSDDIAIPSQGWENTSAFLAWVEEMYAKNPNAFSIDLLQKSAFVEESSHEMNEKLLNQETIQENDVYLRYIYQGSGDANRIQMNRIRPCTVMHIKKYTAGIHKRVLETPELYANIVKPYIQSIPASRTAWIQKGICQVSYSFESRMRSRNCLISRYK
jgi:hypothetical protein